MSFFVGSRSSGRGPSASREGFEASGAALGSMDMSISVSSSWSMVSAVAVDVEGWDRGFEGVGSAMVAEQPLRRECNS